jgi:hypothetical protein
MLQFPNLFKQSRRKKATISEAITNNLWISSVLPNHSAVVLWIDLSMDTSSKVLAHAKSA